MNKPSDDDAFSVVAIFILAGITIGIMYNKLLADKSLGAQVLYVGIIFFGAFSVVKLIAYFISKIK